MCHHATCTNLLCFDLAADDFLAGIPATKVQHYAMEARSLNAARMLELKPRKRYTLAVALVRQQIAQCLDDLAEMLIKKLRRVHRRAHEEFQQALLRRQNVTDQLVDTFHRLLLVWQEEMTGGQKLAAIGALLNPQAGALLEQCQTHAALAHHNHLPFLWSLFQPHRSALFAVIEEVGLIAPGGDKSLEQAVAFLQRHWRSRQEWLAAAGGEGLDLSWIPDRWWKLVTGRDSRTREVCRVSRRSFELCVFTRLAEGLKSGDLVIVGSDKFSDYSDQFVTDEEYRATASQYCEQAGLPTHRDSFVGQLRERLVATASAVDAAFPENEHFRIENSEPVLRRLERRSLPENFQLVEDCANRSSLKSRR